MRWGDRRMKAGHSSIAEAIREQDPELAQVEMESHLRHSAMRILKSGVRSLA